MSWRNPTKKEAEDAYGSAKSRYANAAESYIQNNRQLESCYADYKSCNSKLSSAKSDKISFEKRIEQIEEVIRMLSDDGVVDEAVDKANVAAQRAEEAVEKNIVCEGIKSPSIGSIFKCPKVSENQYSAEAVSELKKEKARLEQALTELDSKLNSMEQEMEALTSKMNSLTSIQTDLSKTMKSCSFEMQHFKKYV